MRCVVHFYLVRIFVLAGMLSVFPVVAIALDTTATVIDSGGSVSAMSSGDQRTLDQGDEIFVRDRVVTGEKSFVVLKFIDGAKVTVRPESTLVVEEYRYNGDSRDTAMLRLVEGGLRVITGEIAKSHPENYKVETPDSLVGVRKTGQEGR